VLVEDGAFVLVSGNDNLFSPRQVALGVAKELGCWVLTADLTWVQWSRFPSPSATVDISLDLGALGDQFRIPPIDRPIPADFHDIFVPRLGAEFTPLDGPDFGLTLRGGYGWEPSPAPEQPGTTNYIDSDKHTFAIGWSLRFPGLAPVMERPLILDFAGSLVWLPERLYRKAAAADPIGDYRADGLVFTASTTLKLLF
jgi:long-chain fatty acid transport protein